jgi:hypothetical protein
MADLEDLKKRRLRILDSRATQARNILAVNYGLGNGNTFETAFIDLLVDALHLGEREKVKTAFIDRAVPLALSLYRAEHPEGVTAPSAEPPTDGQASG